MKRVMLAVIGLALLSGCGIKGGLERPDPMWNREEALAREREQQRQEDELAARRAGQAAGQTQERPSTTTAPAGASEPIPAPQ